MMILIVKESSIQNGEADPTLSNLPGISFHVCLYFTWCNRAKFCCNNTYDEYLDSMKEH